MFPLSSDLTHAAVTSNCFQGSSKNRVSPNCSLGTAASITKIAVLQKVVQLYLNCVMFTNVLTAKMEFPIEKEPYLEESGFFFFFIAMPKYKLFCKGVIVNQAGIK